MDRENDYRTPLDRVDEEFLRRLLGTADQNNSNTPAEERSTAASARVYGSTEKNKNSVSRPLAMVYAEYQCWNALYEPSEGLDSGTIFRELEFPFYPTPCAEKNCAGHYPSYQYNHSDMRREVRRRACCR